MHSTTTKFTSSLDTTYARALFELAIEASRLDNVADQVAQIGRLWDTNPDLDNLLSSLVLSTAERAGVIERAFKGKVDELVFRFFMVVNQKDRLGNLPVIVRAFANLVDERQGIVEVDAYVTNLLDEGQAGAIADRLGASMGRKVELKQHIDSELIGGLKLRIGDKLLDGSVATQLRLMLDKFVQAGRDKARESAAS